MSEIPVSASFSGVRIDDKEDIDALLTAYQMGYIKPIPNNLTVRQRLKLAAPGNVVVVEGLTIYKDGRDWGDRRETFNKFAAAYEGDGMRKYSVPLPGGQRGRLIAYSSDQYLPAKQVVHHNFSHQYHHAYCLSETENTGSPMYHSEDDVQTSAMAMTDCYYERYERYERYDSYDSYERGVSAETQDSTSSAPKEEISLRGRKHLFA